VEGRVNAAAQFRRFYSAVDERERMQAAPDLGPFLNF
jgi:hypothetical protein